ncbi:hypothetical protein [Parachitinimonas caeni]|uniref:Uncharacterized protein n=1 Tax=Parachitinimonas caeni TaxID=3031301 RepID=A0ABT7E2Y0_9NEIS|nr:hypothetical protein [Parachitinimonas caeni]MDK2126658.1 hypothetical protein [Parachitinimonas caeni]
MASAISKFAKTAILTTLPAVALADSKSGGSTGGKPSEPVVLDKVSSYISGTISLPAELKNQSLNLYLNPTQWQGGDRPDSPRCEIGSGGVYSCSLGTVSNMNAYDISITYSGKRKGSLDRRYKLAQTVVNLASLSISPGNNGARNYTGNLSISKEGFTFSDVIECAEKIAGPAFDYNIIGHYSGSDYSKASYAGSWEAFPAEGGRDAMFRAKYLSGWELAVFWPGPTHSLGTVKYRTPDSAKSAWTETGSTSSKSGSQKKEDLSAGWYMLGNIDDLMNSYCK